jgi:hypothetical protein
VRKEENVRRFGLALLLPLVLAAPAVLGGEKPQAHSAPGRTLAVYFSRTGNTTDVARRLHASVNMGASDIGTGTKTVMVMVVARGLKEASCEPDALG